MHDIKVNGSMRSREWWTYTLISTLPDSPEWREIALRFPQFGENELKVSAEAYSMALARLRARDLSSRSAKVLLAQAKCLRKWRIADPIAEEHRKQEALDSFLRRNDAARALVGSEQVPWAIACGMKRILSNWLPEIRETVDGRFGPGAVFEGWSHPRRFTELARWVRNSEHWPEVPSDNGSMGAHTCRLCAVPKQFDKDRLITVEPAYASFAQQAVRSTILESIHMGPLAGSCMDLGYTDGQTIQRRLALRASSDKRLATLDLKDASDNITWEAVQTVFPSWIVRLLEVTRSSHYRDPRVEFDAPLGIYAGMGNATTFVVETLFFAAYVKAFAWCRGLSTPVSVFGDDVICRSDVAALLVREGQSPCFVINEDKSFIGEDGLRESCGIFAYEGADITVPRFDGYEDSPAGAIGLRDVEYRCTQDPLFFGVASAICQDSGLPCYRHWIEGYPSLVDPLFMVGEESVPNAKWSAELQQLGVKLAWWEPRVVSLRCTDAPDDDTTRGLLAACLLGQARTRRCGSHHAVVFPARELQFLRGPSMVQRKRWHRVIGYTPFGRTA